MTWTYSTALTADRDKVRIAIGDTATADQQFSDEEIAYFLTVNTTVRGAAIVAVEALIAKYSRQTDRKVGPLDVSASQRVKGYQALLATLRAREATAASPFAGGISINSKQTYEEDDDLVQPAFFRGLQDNSSATEQTPATSDRTV